jgi:voltage-gated potassium channel
VVADLMKRMLLPLLLIVAYFLFGTLLFHLMLGWSLVDSFYMTAITISTVGYGAPADLGQKGEILAAVMSILAVVIYLTAFVGLAQALLEGHLVEFFWRRRMQNKVDKLKNHYIISGYGRIGHQLALDMLNEGEEFVVIEKGKERIQELKEAGYNFVEGDATQDETLIQAGIKVARGLYVTFPDDSLNLLVVLSARGLSWDLQIVARVNDPLLEEKYRRAGTNTTMNFYQWTSRNMMTAMIRPSSLDLLFMILDSRTDNVHLGEMSIPYGSKIAGKTLAESRFRQVSGINIIGVYKASTGETIPSPPADLTIEEEDIVIFLGDRNNIRKIKEQMRSDVVVEE